jgi:DNA replication and repair protein RecF
MKLERVSDMMGLFHVVIFAPEDLMLIKEGPATRRRYLDLLISQVKPSYFIHLQQFARILSQRNMLLKQLREKGQAKQKKINPDFNDQMAVWDETLAQEGSFLIKQRQVYANRIEEYAEKAQKNITSGKEKLSVKYKTVSGIDPNKSNKEIYHQYIKRLKRKIYDDIEKGVTADGPHRDDLILSLDEAEVKAFASQGQQRSAVLALKLSELMILTEETGETPVFLLDDVMSELDEKRRKGLLNNINDAQVFVTCTDKEPLMKELKWANQVLKTKEKKEIQWSIFNVKEGNVMPKTRENF